MSLFGAGTQTLQLRSARLHGPADKLRARQQLERALAAVDIPSTALSPQAVLIVRRIAINAREDPSCRLPFGARVEKELRLWAQRARRPWLHDDDLFAEAVVFADEAELVACLIRDTLHGRVAGCWWWHSVLGGASPTQWLRQNAITRGEMLVPAISLLARRGDAVAFVAQLELADSEAAIAAIVRSHSVSLFPREDESVPPQPPRTRGPGHFSNTRKRRKAEAIRKAIERLVVEVPEVCAPTLGTASRQLLALSLALIRAPSWSRSKEFALAVEMLGHTIPEVMARALKPRDIVRQEWARRIDVQESIETSVLPLMNERVGGTPFVAKVQPALPLSSVPGSGIAAEDEDPGQERAIAQAPATTAEEAGAAISAPALSNPDDAPVSVTRSDNDGVAAVPRVSTEFGGIFYLLNAALALGLYGDFTAPLAKNLELSPWDWLALVGRAWFGEEFVDDALWTVLAELAGRTSDDEPDRDFHPPSENWLREHLATLDARIALALGAEDESDVHAFVCQYDAGIEITASAVHVHLELRDLPLDLRIAGLDRDPGWIPAAGRAVYFHFA